MEHENAHRLYFPAGVFLQLGFVLGEGFEPPTFRQLGERTSCYAIPPMWP